MSQSVVYISSEYISVVVAEVKRSAIRIEDFFRIPLQEGTMLNGVIIDENELKDSLLKLVNKDIHKVSLIVDSAKIVAKTATIPRMKEKEIVQFVKDELSTVENNNDDNVYDFAYLSPDDKIKGASKILCVSVERQFIENYINIFDSVGIELETIDYAVNVMISLVKELPGFIDKTYAVSQIDGQNLVSVLFIDNEYTLTNRSRIYANKGTKEYENEIGGTISQLKQFASSSSNDIPISDLYLFGYDKSEKESLFSSVEIISHLTVSSLPKSKLIYTVDNREFDLNDYVYCIGYLIRK